MNSILLTNSGINKNTGGGIVSFNLMEALKECTDLKYIHCNQKFPDNKINNIPCYSTNPVDYGYIYKPNESYFYWPTPFFSDYMSFHLLPEDIPINLAVCYGCPFGLTIEELKREFNCRVVTDLAPHNIEVSREEHQRHGASYPYPHLVDHYTWGLYSRHLRGADIVVVHSRKSAEYIKEKAKLQINPIVIPHGCYLPERIEDYPVQFTPSYFGAVGYDKGAIYLVNAWLNCKYPTNQPTISQLWIGGAESQGIQIKDEYKNRFRMIGAIQNISDFYNKTSIYIQSSVTEGFGITPLEAMAHARPVIISEGAGCSELITNGKEGFVVPIRDSQAIANKIQYFIDNPSEIKRMGTEARKTAEQNTWDKIKNRYKQVFVGDKIEPQQKSEIEIT